MVEAPVLDGGRAGAEAFAEVVQGGGEGIVRAQRTGDLQSALGVRGDTGEPGGVRGERALIAVRVVEGETPVDPADGEPEAVTVGMGGEARVEVGAAGGQDAEALGVGPGEPRSSDPVDGTLFGFLGLRVDGRLDRAVERQGQGVGGAHGSSWKAAHAARARGGGTVTSMPSG